MRCPSCFADVVESGSAENLFGTLVTYECQFCGEVVDIKGSLEEEEELDERRSETYD